MSATRLNKVAAIYLTTLYGVVGLVGPSLHYLATDPFGIWTVRGTVETSEYYHVHAPDYHGHFHKHRHHGTHSHAGMGVSSIDHNATQDIRLTSEKFSHDPHACPALALVSTLKLSHVGTTCISLILDSFCTLSCELRRIQAHELARYACPRGPPTSAIA